MGRSRCDLEIRGKSPMKVYCMSDIHGFLNEFNEALALVEKELKQSTDTMLVLLGDYVHYGYDSRGVVDRIVSLQEEYGHQRVIALRGNHEDMVLSGNIGLDDMCGLQIGERVPQKYIRWMRQLRYHYEAGHTIFVHAGIDEEAGDLWKIGTSDDIFAWKFPPTLGEIPGIDMKVVAGHSGTSTISGDPDFHGIYYDGASHYFIDGSVIESGYVNVLMVDTDTDRYYEVNAEGTDEVKPCEDYIS